MLSESIRPIRKKKVEIVPLNLEYWMPIELCEGCTGGMLFIFLQQSHSLKTYIHQLLSEQDQDRRQGSEM